MISLGGVLAAAADLRQPFPEISDNTKSREFARVIASWKRLRVAPRPVTEGDAA